ncbi:MAG: DMT family transporter [Pseudomonadota bacterium]
MVDLSTSGRRAIETLNTRRRWGRALHPNVRSMLLMVFAMGVFVLNDTLTKTVSARLETGQIIVIRGVICTIIMLPIALSLYSVQRIFTCYSRALLVRNLAEMGAVIIFLSALFQLPIANVTAILQVLPLAMTAAAAVVLKEHVGWRRWTAAGVGLVGVLFIIRPGTADFSWWYLAVLFSVILITARDLATRFIAPSTPTVVVTLLTAICVTGAGLMLSAYEALTLPTTASAWVVPELGDLGRLTLAAILVLVGYATLIEAWRTGEISATAPFRYSVVLWAILFGYLLLGEVPKFWTLFGSAIVVAAGLYTFMRERKRANEEPASSK